MTTETTEAAQTEVEETKKVTPADGAEIMEALGFNEPAPIRNFTAKEFLARCKSNPREVTEVILDVAGTPMPFYVKPLSFSDHMRFYSRCGLNKSKIVLEYV